MSESKIKSNVCIGVDLGTTYSCVSVMRGEEVIVIPNDQGNRTTPSYVAFNEDEKLVGESAKNQCGFNHKNTLHDIKRLIGRRFSDKTVQADMKLWAFDVVDENDQPRVEVDYKGERKRFRPEEISAMVLIKMKETAEAFLGCEVKSAVITCPAYFNDAQRASTKDAAVIAGLIPLRILNEPTAACLSYTTSFMKDETKEKTILVFDLGGGTFDVSLMSVDGDLHEVRSVGGSTHLGGSDLDNRLVEYCVQEFKKKHKIDLKENDRALRRLNTACERAKRTLSSQMETTIEIDSLMEGIDFTTTITRARFEDICSDIFAQCIPPIEQVLKDGKISKGQIDLIIMVGGSTRIPKVQKMVKDFFNGKELCNKVNPDEAVCVGAGIMAAILTGQSKKGTVLIDVTPLSLGIEESGRNMAVLIPRGTSIPCQKKQTFSTAADGQQSVDIRIFEGERPLTQHNNLLGNFRLDGIPSAHRGEPQIEVSMDIDSNGILEVTACDVKSGNKKNITVKNDSTKLSKQEIERIIAEAEKNKIEDEKVMSLHRKKNQLENYASTMKSVVEDGKAPLSEEDKGKISEAVKKVEDWLKSVDDSSDYEGKQKEIEEICRPIINQLYKGGEGGAPMPEGSSESNSATSTGPKVEEVD